MSEQPERERLFSKASYEEGCNLVWCGVRAEDMTREELVCFAHNIDAAYAMLVKENQEK